MSAFTEADIDRQTARAKAGLPLEGGNAEPTLADSAPLQLAITGYMWDRAALIEQMPSLELQYDSHRDKRDWIKVELARIDKAVADLLHERRHAVIAPLRELNHIAT